MMRTQIQRAGPALAAFGALLGIVLFALAVAYTVNEQRKADTKLCLQTVENRAATRGIWEGARRLSLRGIVDPETRAAAVAFFDELLAPYPELRCDNGEPVPATIAARELVSFVDVKPPGPPGQTKKLEQAPIPCVPFLPFTCPPPPSDPPATPPAAHDDPPQMVSLFIDSRRVRTLTLGWDSVKRATAGARARRSRIWFPCGLHIYAVEAVDTSGQRDALQLRARRRCTLADAVRTIP